MLVKLSRKGQDALSAVCADMLAAASQSAAMKTGTKPSFAPHNQAKPESLSPKG